MSTQFRKKPVVVEAWQWEGNQLLAGAPKWVLDYRDGGNARVRAKRDGTLSVPTLEGIHTASIGDWIIRGVKGEIYPCKPDIFEATYEPDVGEETPLRLPA